MAAVAAHSFWVLASYKARGYRAGDFLNLFITWFARTYACDCGAVEQSSRTGDQR
jgi:hypothetical protein